MRHRIVHTLILGLAALQIGAAPGRADALPQPERELRDYDGKGVIYIDLMPADPGAEGKPAEPGLCTWIEMRQAFVAPDRLLVDLSLFATRQITLTMGSTERTFNPVTPYVIEKTYKNVERVEEIVVPSRQLSMEVYRRLLLTLNSGRLLPDEDLDATERSHRARIPELEEQRKQLRARFAEQKNPADFVRINEISAEMARLRDDLNQVPIRRAHPCYGVEFDNRELMGTLLSRGLMGQRARDILEKGKTRFWVTRAEGLPIKIETTDNRGRVALFFCFTELKINTGLRPSELVLGAPPGCRLVRVTADVREKNWEDKMEEEIARQVRRLEEERLREERAQRQLAAPGTLPPASGKKKK